MTVPNNITSRRTAIAAARARAEEVVGETISVAGHDAMRDGVNVSDAEREAAHLILAQPRDSYSSWIATGTPRAAGIQTRWKGVFLREFDRATAYCARRFLRAPSPD